MTPARATICRAPAVSYKEAGQAIGFVPACDPVHRAAKSASFRQERLPDRAKSASFRRGRGNRLRSVATGEIGFVPSRQEKSASFRRGRRNRLRSVAAGEIGFVPSLGRFGSLSLLLLLCVSWRLLASWRFNSPHFPTESFRSGRADRNL